MLSELQQMDAGAITTAMVKNKTCFRRCKRWNADESSVITRVTKEYRGKQRNSLGEWFSATIMGQFGIDKTIKTVQPPMMHSMT